MYIYIYAGSRRTYSWMSQTSGYPTMLLWKNDHCRSLFDSWKMVLEKGTFNSGDLQQYKKIQNITNASGISNFDILCRTCGRPCKEHPGMSKQLLPPAPSCWSLDFDISGVTERRMIRLLQENNDFMNWSTWPYQWYNSFFRNPPTDQHAFSFPNVLQRHAVYQNLACHVLTNSTWTIST